MLGKLWEGLKAKVTGTNRTKSAPDKVQEGARAGFDTAMQTPERPLVPSWHGVIPSDAIFQAAVVDPNNQAFEALVAEVRRKAEAVAQEMLAKIPPEETEYVTRMQQVFPKWIVVLESGLREQKRLWKEQQARRASIQTWLSAAIGTLPEEHRSHINTSSSNRVDSVSLFYVSAIWNNAVETAQIIVTGYEQSLVLHKTHAWQIQDVVERHRRDTEALNAKRLPKKR